MSEGAEIPRVREYRLDLDVRHREMDFSGTVEVVLERPVRQLRLNCVGLEADCPVEGAAVRAHPESEEIWIDLPHEAPIVPVRFRGRVAERGLTGFYRSRYGSSYILTTHCEATNARRLFPCIDRPDRKAVVSLTLTIDAGLEAIFNTPVRSSAEPNGRQRLTFEPTPPMSTYLAFLAVGRFDWTPGPPGRVRVAVAAPPGRGGAGAFSAQRAAEILPAFERYYDLPFPLPKLDLVAVPEFAYGAMENWGAISFREMRLLVDDATDPRQRRQTLATIAHEIAHQWFGNLVTMSWWTDIWLNESFATFMEQKLTGELYPAAGSLDEFLIDWSGAARTGDSLPSSHPIRVPVERPEEIGEIFDEISYGKGSSVLRMVEAFIGADAFRAGVTRYLKDHAYGNAASDDLWAALETAAGRSLRPLLEAWITRPGLPMLRARLDAPNIEIRQERYSLDGHHTSETWPIPLAISRDGALEHRLIDSARAALPAGTDGPVHLNSGALGFYRVLYDAPLYARLRAAFPSLPGIDRWNVLEDLSAFVLSGDAPMSRYYEFLEASRPATEYLLVHSAASQLSSTSPGRPPTAFGALVGGEPEFRRHAVGFLSTQLERVGLEPRSGEPEVHAVLRERLAASLVPLDEAFARGMADRFGTAGLRPELKWPAALAYAHLGSEREFDTLVATLGRTTDEGDANRLERALGRFRDPKLVERALGLALTPAVNRAHLVDLVREAALNPSGRASTWEWIRTRLHEVEDRYRDTGIIANILYWALPYAALGRSEEAGRELSARPFSEGARAAAKGLFVLGVYERWFARGR